MVAPSQLLDLQAIDTAIDRLDARKRALEGEGELAAARAQAELAERELGELRLTIDTFDRDGAKLEHEIDSITRKAADEESRLYGGAVANAKELGSIQHEVDNLKNAGDAARELDAASAELVTRRDERARLAAGIDPELLELYEDLRPQKKGVAAVALVDGVCQGCHEKLSSVEFDRVKRTDGIARCEYCRRILVL